MSAHSASSTDAREGTMTLNGWHRLFVVSAVVWAIWLLTQGWEIPNAISLKSAITLWAVPLTLLYLAGLAAAWVRRGFQQPA